MPRPPRSTAATRSTPARKGHLPGWCAGAALLVLIALVYGFVTRYSFAQDDFVFLENASLGFRESVGSFFGSNPGQFRPLTKGLYFLFMWPVFSLHAFPYHVVSIVLHWANAMLVAVLLRRLGVSRMGSWAAALLFAVHVLHFEAVAWVSCVQQLAGSLFNLLALVFGLDAVAGRGRRAEIAAAAAYLLALCSYEQTLAAPLILLVWVWLHDGRHRAWGTARGPLLGMFVLMFVYGAYVFVWRGMPDSGPYVMHLGTNVLANLRDYTGSVFAFWLTLPEFGLPQGLTWSHAIGVVLAGVLLATRRPRELAFGCIVFLVLIGPVLFTSQHVHTFHLYLPMVGACYLLGCTIDAIRAAVTVPRRRAAGIVLALVVAVTAAGACISIERNARATISSEVKLPRDFVLRRAVLADRVCRDVQGRWSGGSRLVLVYVGDPNAANLANIRSALGPSVRGEGSALRLALQQPGLDVQLGVLKSAGSLPESGIMILTDLGHTFTTAEWRAMMTRRVPAPSQGPD